jgi:hypothetical protein
MANNAAIEQQYRHFEAELADELRIGVDIDHGDGREGLRPFELGQPVEHFVTKPATLAGDHDETLDHGETTTSLFALRRQPHGSGVGRGFGGFDLLGEKLDRRGWHFTHRRDLMAIHHG